MTVCAFLYDAPGSDHETVLTDSLVSRLRADQILWVDVESKDPDEVARAVRAVGARPELVKAVLETVRRPTLNNYGDSYELSVQSISESEGRYKLHEIRFVLLQNVVVAIHGEPIEFIDSFNAGVRGDTRLGELHSASFLASLLDWHITSFFRIIEKLEQETDRLDEQALRMHQKRNLLSELDRLRRLVALVRRTLTPHREVYSSLARPDFVLFTDASTAPDFAALSDRLARAISGVENARELLVGSFDMFTTHTALRTNEVVKTLTIVNAVLLPATLITGIMPLVLRSPVYNAGRESFWGLLLLMMAIAAGTIAFFRKRQWI